LIGPSRMSALSRPLDWRSHCDENRATGIP